MNDAKYKIRLLSSVDRVALFSIHCHKDKDGMFLGSMAGCVFAYFAECTVVMPLFLLIAILRNVGVGMLRFAWAWPHRRACLG